MAGADQCARPTRTFQRRMNRIVPIGLLITFGGAATCFMVWADYDRGLPRDQFVRKTVSQLQGATSPAEIESRVKGAGTLRLKSGEWVTGIGVDSHSWKRAKDTLVLQDSRGKVSVFIGHMCGPTWMPRYFGGDFPEFCPDLDAFYTFLSDWGCKPYQLPEE